MKQAVPWFLAGLILLAIAILPAVHALSRMPGKEGEPVTVIMAPWAAAGPAIRQAGGMVILPGRAPFVAMAAGPEEDFIARLRMAGAWFVASGSLAGFLCATP